MALSQAEARAMLEKAGISYDQPAKPSGGLSQEEAMQMLNSAGIQPPSPAGMTPELPTQGASEGQGVMPYLAALLSGGKRGVGELGAGAARMVAQGADKLTGSNLQQQMPQYQLQGIDKSIAQAHPTTANIGEFAAKAAPMFMAPELGGSLAGQMAGQAAVGGIEGAIESPEDRLKGLLLGMAGGASGPLVGKGFSAVGRGTKSGIEKAIAKAIGGKKTAEEIDAIQKSAGALGAKLPAAQIIGSPGLKRFQETVLSKLPFSGMHKASTEVGDVVTNKMNTILSDLNKTEGRAGSIVKKEIQEKYDSLNRSASDKYDRVAAMLSKQNPPHDVTDLVNEASKVKKKILRDSSFGGKSVGEYTELKPILDSLEDSPIKNIGDAFKKDKIINQRIRDASGEERKMLSNLKDVNLDSISKTVKKYGSDDLNSQYNVAKNFYKKVFVPFRDNDQIAKIIDKETKIDDVIPTVFGTSATKGKGDILESVAPHLSQDAKDAVLHEHLSTKLDEPEKKVLSKIKRYEKLQKSQKDMLVKPEHRELLDSMSDIKNHMGDTAFNDMFVEKTGASLQPFAVGSALGSAGVAAGGGLPGAIAALIAGGGAGRYATKKIMSDTIPELSKRVLSGSKRPLKSGDLQKLIAPLAISLMNQENKSNAK